MRRYYIHMATGADEAVSMFNQGFNCAQSLLAAFGVKLGVDFETSIKLGSAFGGGMGLGGGVCGAVTGAFAVIGLRFGAVDAKDREAKARMHKCTERFVREFKSRNRSITCCDLIGFDIQMKNRKPESHRIISERCPVFVRDAAEIIEEILQT